MYNDGQACWQAVTDTHTPSSLHLTPPPYPILPTPNRQTFRNSIIKLFHKTPSFPLVGHMTTTVTALNVTSTKQVYHPVSRDNKQLAVEEINAFN